MTNRVELRVKTPPLVKVNSICVDKNIEQLNCEGYCANMQLFYQSFISQKHEALFLFSSNHFSTVKIQLRRKHLISVWQCLLLQYLVQRLPVSWCCVGWWTFSFQPVDFVKIPCLLFCFLILEFSTFIKVFVLSVVTL